MDIAYISSLKSYHQAKFEIEKDSPQVIGLKEFIRYRLLKNLSQVHVWSIEPYIVGKAEEDARPFSLEFNDGCQVKGALHRQRDGRGQECWSVGDDWRVTF